MPRVSNDGVSMHSFRPGVIIILSSFRNSDALDTLLMYSISC